MNKKVFSSLALVLAAAFALSGCNKPAPVEGPGAAPMMGPASAASR